MFLRRKRRIETDGVGHKSVEELRDQASHHTRQTEHQKKELSIAICISISNTVCTCSLLKHLFTYSSPPFGFIDPLTSPGCHTLSNLGSGKSCSAYYHGRACLGTHLSCFNSTGLSPYLIFFHSGLPLRLGYLNRPLSRFVLILWCCVALDLDTIVDHSEIQSSSC